MRSARGASTLILVSILAAAGSHPAGQTRADTRLTPEEADRFQRKWHSIVEYGQAARAPSVAPRRTPVSEVEVNSYLRFLAANQIPAGVADPYIRILDGGRVEATAVVDLDAVRRQRDRGWLDPLGYLSGRVPVRASGVLRTRDGVAALDLERAEISGVPVPKVVLQELVSHYSRTPENPTGLDLDAPFVLPANIREIRVRWGEATVIQ